MFVQRLLYKMLCVILALSILLPGAQAHAYRKIYIPASPDEAPPALGHPSAARASRSSGESTYTSASKVQESSDEVATSSAASEGPDPIDQLSSDLTPEPDTTLFTGAATYNVPISVPPGRAGVSPKIALSYNSYRRQNGWIGIGWDLDLGSIQRATKHGLNYLSTNFVFVHNGGVQELTRRTGWDTYCSAQGEGAAYETKIEGGFARFCYDSTVDSWTVTTKDGAKRSYGDGTAASRQTSPQGTFRWLLTKTVDVDGNYMAVSYSQDGGQVYPARIEYTGNDRTGLAASNAVEFITEARSDVQSSYVSAAQARTARRLKTVNVKGTDGTLIRRYDLNYDQSANSGRSRLVSVTEYGDDGVTPLFGTAAAPIPSQTFSWGTKIGTVERKVQLTAISDQNISFSCSWRSEISFGDFNADGLKDIAYTCDNGVWVGINTPTAGGLSQFTMEQVSTHAFSKKMPFIVADIDRDGYDDLIYDEDSTATETSLRVLLNKGDHFEDAPFAGARRHTYVTFQDGSGYMPFTMADVNGDGYPDIVYYGSMSDLSIWVLLNNAGQGFAGEASWAKAPSGWMEVGIGDYNGDGLADLIFVLLGHEQLYIRQSAGNCFLARTTPTVFSSGEVDSAYDFNLFITDMNGDGLSDTAYVGAGELPWTQPWNRKTASIKGLISDRTGIQFEQAWPNWNTANTFFYFSGLGDVSGDGTSDLTNCLNCTSETLTGSVNAQMNTGDPAADRGFLAAYRWQAPQTLPGGVSGSTGVLNFVDLNGDGLTDTISDYSAGPGQSYLFMAQAAPNLSPDLITGITTGFGGSYYIKYKPYAGEPGVGHLPFVVQTVSSIKTDDANGNTSTTSYLYANGRYDWEDREFRGFEEVQKLLPNGTTVDTRYYQDDILKGLAYSEATRSTTTPDLLYKETDRAYQIRDVVTGTVYPAGSEPAGTIHFPMLQGTTYSLFDATGTSYQVETDYQYDPYGNVTRKHSLGDTSVSGDERDELAAFAGAYDLTSWLLARPVATSVKDAAGALLAKTSFAYVPASNRVATEAHWLDMKEGTESDPVITYIYDSVAGSDACNPANIGGAGNPRKIRDPKGQYSTEISCYDATETYPATLINGLGHKVARAYNRFGKITQETDPNGNATRYDYDGFGRMIRMTNQIDYDKGSTYGTVQYSYTSFGSSGQRIEVYQTEKSGTSSFLWKKIYLDGLGRAIRTETEGPGSTTIVSETVYDDMGKVSSKSLPHFSTDTPKWTTYTYDRLGRVATTTYPDQSVSKALYNKNLTSLIDPMGRKREYSANAYGQTEWVYDYSGTTAATYSLYSTTHYIFDAMGRLASIVDPAGNQTSMTYDSLSRRREMTHPDMGAWSYHYDPNGNLDRQTDARVSPIPVGDPPPSQITYNTIAFEYDPLNRITRKLYPDSSEVSYLYDDPNVANSVGRLTGAYVMPASGLPQAFLNSTRFVYDALGRATSTTYNVKGTTKQILTAYDAMGRTSAVTYPDGEKVSYLYDTGGNLKQVTGYATFLDYTALGQVKTMAFANGVTTNLGYYEDTHQRLQLLQTTGPGGTYQDMSYDAYDKAGNITSITDNVDPTIDQTFVYEATPRGRLIRATTPAYGNLITHYDALDNFTSQTGVGAYTVKPGTATLLETAGPYSFEYDQNGNMTRLIKKNTNGDFVSQRMISYDFENRPATITSTGVDTSFEYDYSGMRTLKRSAPSTTLYFGSLYECTDGVCEKHIFAGNSRIATKKSATEIYYYHPDHLGSTRVVTDINGAVVQTDFYDPYGKTRTETGTAALPYKYTGQQEDPETGFYYYKARYYDPVIGRFLTPDPLFQATFDPPTFPRLFIYGYLPADPPLYSNASTKTGGNVPAGAGPKSVHPNLGDSPAAMSAQNGINRFAYCLNNPINFVDPLGLFNTRLFFSSSFGIVSNAFGAIAGGLALSFPSGVTQVLGGVVLAKSLYGFGASAANWEASLYDEPARPSSLAGAVADYFAPGSVMAQRLAAAADLSLDLAFLVTAGSATAALDAGGLSFDPFQSPSWLTQVKYWNPTDLGTPSDIFASFSAGNAVVDTYWPSESSRGSEQHYYYDDYYYYDYGSD